MKDDELLQIFKDEEAYLEGHFILSSGRHSPIFFQKTKLFMKPRITEIICKKLAEKVTEKFGQIDVVVAPAVGAIIPGYETAKHLNAISMYVERENGVFKLRRGFKIEPNQRVLVVEDVITTGLSLRECIASIMETGEVNLVGAACLVDRSNGKALGNIELVSLLSLDVPSYAPDDLPEELKKIPAVKPGSRDLTKNNK